MVSKFQIENLKTKRGKVQTGNSFERVKAAIHLNYPGRTPLIHAILSDA